MKNLYTQIVNKELLEQHVIDYPNTYGRVVENLKANHFVFELTIGDAYAITAMINGATLNNINEFFKS